MWLQTTPMTAGTACSRKIDRTNQDPLDVEHNDITYTGRQMNGVIKMLEDGNKHAGGLGKPRVFFGITSTQCSLFRM